MKNPKKMYYRLFLLCLFFAPACRADFFNNQTEQNNEEPVYITSESGEFNRETGTDVYRIDVQIDQGNTHVNGAVVTTHTGKDNKLEEAIIDGDENNQAHYRTKPNPDKGELHAYADVIKFYPKKNLIILVGNATITQDKNSIKGELLEYDIKKQTLKSLAVNDKQGKKSRTSIVFTPDRSETITETLSKKNARS